MCACTCVFEGSAPHRLFQQVPTHFRFSPPFSQRFLMCYLCVLNKERRNTTFEAESSKQVRLWPLQLLGMVTRQWLSRYIYMVQWPIHQGFTQVLIYQWFTMIFTISPWSPYEIPMKSRGKHLSLRRSGCLAPLLRAAGNTCGTHRGPLSPSRSPGFVDGTTSFDYIWFMINGLYMVILDYIVI